METPAPSRHVLPPWNNPAFLTEAGLKEAQEYFFQTHATNSRMIAQGREATGFMKGHIRRRLAKEMGEDFKMYTGVALGAAGGEDAESKGIRGELNELLKHVYLKIAPTQPITSPIQEDLTILRHPLGGLEVLFAMGCFYTDLMKRYASLAGDRRKVLKSVLDEEVFKWVWRTFYAVVMADKKVPPTFRETIPSSGIRFVPVDKQRLDSRAKLVEFGEFLLGSGLGQSHLRFPLCFYFVNMLRQIQYRLLPVYDRNVVEAVFRKIQKRTPNEPIDDVLVAIDVLMNTKGNTQQAFDDVLANEERDVPNFVPPPEIQFIDSFQEFQGTGFNASMKKFIPQVTKEEILEGQGVTLMPLLLLLRTLPYATTERILEKVPGPFLNLLKNRIAHGNIDDVGRGLLDRIDEMIKARRQRGEQYTIYGGTGRVSSKREAAKAAEAAPDTKKPAGAPSAAPAAPGGETLEPGAAHEEAPAAEAPAAPRAARGSDALLHEPLVVDWQADNGSITVFSLAAQDIIDLGGADPRLLLPWVLFALRTGQVFAVPPQEVSREKVESLLRDLIKASGQGGQARLSADQRKALYEKNKGQPPGKVLIALLKDFGIEGMPIDAQGAMAVGIVGLQKKLGNQLQAFIMNPNQEGFKAYLQELTGPERQAVRVLNRVAKTQ